MQNLKNNINLKFHDQKSPKISEIYKELNEDLRMKKIPNIINNIKNQGFDTEWFEIIRWEPANQIILNLKIQTSAKFRGENLLKLEKILKNIIDPAIEVYLDSKEDKNKLRKFRGVQIVNQ